MSSNRHGKTGARQLVDYLERFDPHQPLYLVGPLTETPSQLAARTEPCIFVDGGTTHRQGREGFSVGDQDSHTGALDWLLPQNKDLSDLAQVLDILPEPFSCIKMLGFMGGRRDHELMNFGEVHRFLKRRLEPAMVNFSDAVIAYSAGDWAFSHNGVFSLFLFQPAELQLTGDVAYPYQTPKPFPECSSLGLSNQAFGRVQLACSGPVFVFLDSTLKA